MVALWSLLRGTPNEQEQLAATTATTSVVQRRKTNKPIVDEANAVQAAGTSNDLPRPLGQNSVKRVAKKLCNLAALTSSSVVMSRVTVDAALHSEGKADALELIYE